MTVHGQAGLEGAARARGYAWGASVAERLRARQRALPPWPGWQSSRVRAIARRKVAGLSGDHEVLEVLARACESEATRRYERLRADATRST